MFKPKQIAPFFSMTPYHLSKILKEIHVVHPLNQTPLGSFLLTKEDLPMIETYQKTLSLFGNKKLALIQLKEYIEGQSVESEGYPEWHYMIKKQSS